MGSNATLFRFHVLMEGRAGPPPPRPSPVGTPSFAVALVGSWFGFAEPVREKSTVHARLFSRGPAGKARPSRRR